VGGLPRLRRRLNRQLATDAVWRPVEGLELVRAAPAPTGKPPAERWPPRSRRVIPRPEFGSSRYAFPHRFQMIRRLPVLIVLVATCVACGSAAAHPSGLYAVTSIVMQKPGEAPRACFAVPLPEPPIGCGGPALDHTDISTMPGFTNYRNGVRASGMVRLVGTWDSQKLTLTRAPEAAAITDQTQAPNCAQDGSEPQGPGLPPMMQKVADDSSTLEAHGIQVLEMYMCKNSLFMVVPVADQPSVDFLTSRYGNVKVDGWLLPVRSG
jgi:hypothetical protein